jgi:bifunctional enzyme CysN/CysC
LRLLTCGSVDDGKSTLIGRLLYEAGSIPEDQLTTLERDSKKYGTTGDDVDLALLVDGLEAERQQGITIDVAYRFFNTSRRSFIIADTPGHEQYTRNMATGASSSDFAIILVDARKGVLPQTRRHSYICSLLGIRHVVLAVNKIDLVDYDPNVFENICNDFSKFSEPLEFSSAMAIPISARYGDNITARSQRITWYAGPTLIEHLETVDVESDAAGKPFRFPVQWVNRPDHDFRGLSGMLSSGSIRPGDPVVVAGSGSKTSIARIVTYDGDLSEATAGDAVTLTLKDDIEIARGDLLTSPTARAEVADQFAAHIIWLADEPLLPGRSYLMRIGMQYVPAKFTALKHKINVDSLEHIATRKLDLNEIGFGNLSTATPVAFDSYAENRETGAFILIDRITNATVGAGMISFGLRRASNIHLQPLLVEHAEREQLAGHKPAVLWFTGLPGSGKSTIANLVERQLFEFGIRTFLLDGDNVRHGLNRDLGFTDADRVENIRRVGEVAKLFAEAGLIVLCAFISPFRSERRMVRELFSEGEFLEVFIDTSIEECMARDPKGLYAKAVAGKIGNFTGVSSPYEVPENAELVLDTRVLSPEQSAEQIVALLRTRGFI